jgi:cytochrome c oxidase cbb3-type subunit 1
MAAAAKTKTGFDVQAMIVMAICVIGALWSLVAAANGADAAIRVHAWVIGAGFLIGLFGMAGVYSGGGVDVDKTQYNEAIVKYGVIASMFWGVAGLLVGVIIAFQLAFPELLSFPAIPELNFGRLRPLHTSAVIFAFGGNACWRPASTWSSARRGRACGAAISPGSCSGATSCSS